MIGLRDINFNILATTIILGDIQVKANTVMLLEVGQNKSSWFSSCQLVGGKNFIAVEESGRESLASIFC